MIAIKLEGMSAVEAQLRGVAKQANFASVVALNRAAFAGRAAAQAEMQRVFDRPTPWVLGAARVTKATTANPTAIVDLSPDSNKQGVTVARVLAAELKGGDRRQKRFERALSAAGVLPAGWVAIPTSDTPRDAYGNVPSSLIVKILAYFQTFGEQGYRANTTTARRAKLAAGTRRTRGTEYFAVQPDRLTATGARQPLRPGIYQRVSFGAMGKGIRALWFFQEAANYERRFDFHGVADKTARATFAAEWPAAFEQAMRTAR